MKLKDLIKHRDPNWLTLQAKRRSNAMGAHKNKKKLEKSGYEKHKAHVV